MSHDIYLSVCNLMSRLTFSIDFLDLSGLLVTLLAHIVKQIVSRRRSRCHTAASMGEQGDLGAQVP